MSERVCALLCVFLVLLFFVTCKDPRIEEGYPKGFMSARFHLRLHRHLPPGPESEKPACIPRRHLKHLFFVVQGKGHSRKKYNYWEAKNIATDPRIDFKRRTMVIALGYLDSSGFPIAAMLANAYEDKGYNVIIVDYQHFTFVRYSLATRLMRPVGKHVAEVLIQLTQAGLDPRKTELIGFSLGGQSVSYIAKNYQQMTGRNISRITALEPAGPCFRTLPPEARLAASDADFVQVVHTNIDDFGMATRMGHVDFYVNGGENQPSEFSFLPCSSTCSHFRVLGYWLSAIKNPDQFIALKCASIQEARDASCFNEVPLSTNVLGINVNVHNPGIFFLSTSYHAPYYLGKNGLKPEFVYWNLTSHMNIGNDTELQVNIGI